MTTESEELVLHKELQEYFNDLKKHSICYKLGQIHETAGDEKENPLHKQFTLILVKIEEILSNHSKESEEHIKLVSMKASIIYEKAKILLGEQLLSESKILLEEALLFIKEYSDHPKIAFLHMRIVNHLTYVLSRLGDLQTAKDLLISAIEDEGKCKPEVFSTDDLFLNTKKDPKISLVKLNRLTINNMQMLAWIFARLGNTPMNLKLQHDILQKQLDLAEGDVLRWAESCFRLAGMYVSQNDWENASCKEQKIKNEPSNKKIQKQSFYSTKKRKSNTNHNKKPNEKEEKIIEETLRETEIISNDFSYDHSYL